jgi:hypothetical protein
MRCVDGAPGLTVAANWSCTWNLKIKENVLRSRLLTMTLTPISFSGMEKS